MLFIEAYREAHSARGRRRNCVTRRNVVGRDYGSGPAAVDTICYFETPTVTVHSCNEIDKGV
jgi:hypothetical protein